MKLTTTRNLISKHTNDLSFLARFDQAYPNIDPDQEVSLINILENKYNTLGDVLCALCATKQDSHLVISEFSRRCVVRTTYTYGCHIPRKKVCDIAKYEYQVARELANNPYDACIKGDHVLTKQEQDIRELLS
jgi:hypothetical protein